MAAALPAHAALKVLATTADWGALATELGGDRVDVYTATGALQDVHRVEAKPSLVARARTADLVVATGAELEVGWLPVLVQESGNRRIQPGSPGYFEAASQVTLLESRRSSTARWATSIRRAIRTCSSIRRTSRRLRKALTRAARCARSRRSARTTQQRGADFDKRWQEAIARWESGPRRSRACRSSSCIATRRISATGSA